ncbi:hypothetical protein [Roseibium litorale]|nr:hypothetical protein [Roseibium litorale]
MPIEQAPAFGPRKKAVITVQWLRSAILTPQFSVVTGASPVLV